MKSKKVCQVCGLPKDICICVELEKNEVECDDFQYCELCGQSHYKGSHTKSKFKHIDLKEKLI